MSKPDAIKPPVRERAGKTQRLEALASAASVAAGLAFYGVFIARTASDWQGAPAFTLADDAMISMRYADNLAHGDGLVWNPGGPAVEGYTNFLWTLWMAFLHWLGLSGSAVSLAVMVTGALLLVLTALAAGAVARRLSGAAWVGVLATLLTAFSYPLAFWTLRGFEVGLIAFLITGSILLCLRIEARPSRLDVALLCGAAFAMTLTRTDAVLFALVCAAWLAFRPQFSRRAAAVLAGVALTTLAGHTALRLALYGDHLPNTYYLRLYRVPLGARIDRGFDTLTEITLNSLWFPTTLAVVAILGRRSAHRALWLPAATVLVAAGYSVWVGGDSLSPNQYLSRFGSVALPALFALAACGVAAILNLSWRTRFAYLALVAGCLAIVLATSNARIASGIAAGAAVGVVLLRRTRNLVVAAVLIAAVGMTDWGAFRGWAHSDFGAAGPALAGVLMARFAPPDASFAVVTAGTIPYYARREAVDILGKNDAHIARLRPKTPLHPGHDKWDYEYSIGKLRPDIIINLWRDPPSPQQLARWGYVRKGCFWVLERGIVDPEAITKACPSRR